MTRIHIPQAVYLRSLQQSQGRGIRQMSVLGEFLARLIPDGEEMDRYERDRNGELFAVTRPFVPDDPELPARRRRKMR